MNILQIFNFHGVNIPDDLWNYKIYNTSQLDESFEITIRIWFTENESKRYIISFDMDSGNGYLRSSVREEEIFEKK